MIIIKFIAAILLILLGMAITIINFIYGYIITNSVFWLSKKFCKGSSKKTVSIWVTICLIIKSPNDLLQWLSSQCFGQSTKISKSYSSK